jgi:fimbrial isopeptide formation D2 family protein/uncharacterized repeat protein (TIGR01451 family)
MSFFTDTGARACGKGIYRPWLMVFSLLACLLVLAAPAHADRAFGKRFAINANGNIAQIGNVLLTCPPSALDCANAQAGGNFRNDDFNMTNVDIDSDPSTFNSSSSDLSMPAGSTVIFAGLYWTGCSTNSGQNQALFKTPTAFGYSLITASIYDTSSFDCYQGYADVTSRVAAAGNGTYMVANVQTNNTNTNGTGDHSGWSLVVVYSNNALPLRNLTVFDGFLLVNTQTISIPVSGFLTPLSGPVNTRLGVIAYDGDLPATGDTFSLNGTALADANNPIDNFYNSTISNLGVTVTSKNPNYVNNLGFDIDLVNVPSGVLANGATSATIAVTSPASTEQFWLAVATFNTDLYVPIITPNIVKTATDLNGGNLVAGDILRWTISMSNTGLDAGTNLMLSDNIPSQLTYSANSLAVTAGANSGSKTDASSDDQAEYVASGTPHVVFRLGTGANTTSGGTLAYNQSTTVTFDTVVNAGLPAGTTINNTANISYQGQTIGTTFAGAGAAATSVVVGPPTISKSFSPNPIATGAAAVMSIVLSNPSSNPATIHDVGFTDTYPGGLVNAAAPNAAITCTAGGTAGTITGGIAGGTSIGLSPGATIPAGGSCTVTVNVTASTSANYTNTTGNVSSSDAGSGSTASATLSVGKPSISKAFAPTSIVSGGTTTLTFTLGNTSLVTLTGMSFSDTLTGMTVAGTPAISNGCGGTLTAAANSSSISLSGGTVGANASCTISVNITSSSAGAQTNTATGVSSTQSGSAGNPSNTATLTVIAPPTITKSFSPTSVRTNSPSQLVMTVTNPNTTTTISGVAFTDTYPANLVNNTPANSTLNCTAGSTATITGGADGGNTLGISGGSLLPGGSCTVAANVISGNSGNYSNSTGTVTTSNAGTGTAASATLNVTALATPGITKAFGAATIATGGTTTMTITLSANNFATISSIAFTDNYPPGLVNGATALVSNSCGGTVTAAAGGNLLALSGGSISALSSCSIVVNVTSSSTGAYVNDTGIVTTSNAGTFGPAQATLNVLAPALIAKAFSPTSVAVSAASTLTITLSNPTSATASLTGVNFTDTFPAGLVVAATPASTNTCGGTYTDTSNGTITAGDTGIKLTGVTLAPNATCSVTVKVSSTTAGAYVNTTGAVGSTNGGAGTTATATLTVGRPGLSKAFSVNPIAVGGSSVLTLTLSNPTATAMTAAAFTDTYPTGMSNTGTPAGATTCAGGTVTAAASGSSVALTGGTIPANGSCTVTVNVSSTLSTTNTVPAGGLTVSGGGSNGTAAAATLLVYNIPTVAKAFSPAVVTPGVASTMTITLTNTNSVASTATAFTDNYPSNMVNAATPALTNTCGGTATANAGAGSLSLSGASIGANGTCTITVAVSSSIAGNYVNNTGAVTTTNIGNSASASASLTVMAAPTVAKAFSPTSVLVNTVSVLSIALTNSNAIAITGAAFTDSYPSGLVNDATPTLSNSCGGTVTAAAGGNSLALTGGTIPASGNCQITVRVQSATVGSYVNNTGSVTTSNAGSGTSAGATLTVTTAQPSLSIGKLVSVFSDPVNLSANPKSIPGAISAYTISVTNTGPGTVDNNTLVITDPVPANTILYVGDIGVAGSGPIVFTNGSPTSGLSYTYTSLASTTDNLDFSSDNGASWTYTPTPDVNGFDVLVTNIRIRPQGVMAAAGGSNPSFTLNFRVKIK